MQSVEWGLSRQPTWPSKPIDLKGCIFSEPNMEGTQMLSQVHLGWKNAVFFLVSTSPAPHTFTRCMDAVLWPLHEEGLQIRIYVGELAGLWPLYSKRRKSWLESSENSCSCIWMPEWWLFPELLENRLPSGLLLLPPLGVGGTHIANCSLGSFKHVPSAVLPPEPLTLPTDKARVLAMHRLCFHWFEQPASFTRDNALGSVLCHQMMSSDTSLVGFGAIHKGNSQWHEPWLA